MSPHEFKHALVAGLPIMHQPVAAIPEPVLAAMARAASDPSRHFGRAPSDSVARASLDYSQVPLPPAPHARDLGRNPFTVLRAGHMTLCPCYCVKERSCQKNGADQHGLKSCACAGCHLSACERKGSERMLMHQYATPQQRSWHRPRRRRMLWQRKLTRRRWSQAETRKKWAAVSVVVAMPPVTGAQACDAAMAELAEEEALLEALSEEEETDKEEGAAGGGEEEGEERAGRASLLPPSSLASRSSAPRTPGWL